MTFVRFVFVGGTAAALQLISLAAMLQVARIDYRLAAAVAFAVSVIFHFLANRHFTFRIAGAPEISQVARYLVIVGLNFLLTLAVTSLSVEVFHWSAYVGTVLSILTTVSVSYGGSKYWVFVHKRTHSV